MDDKNHSAARHFVSFIIVALMAGVFITFWSYQENIFENGTQEQFVVLSIIAGAFLVGLLYLVNKPHTKPSKKKKK